MRTLHRYVLVEMLGTLVVAVLVCIGLLLLGNLLKEILALLMAGRATLPLVLRGIGLLIPYVLVYALPMGVLTAALLVFGRLSADQELTAARANGIGVMAMAFPVVILGLALCGVCAWVNMELAPRCRGQYKQLFQEIAREQARSLIPAGRFVTEFPGFVLYADRIAGEEMIDVLFFQVREGRKVRDIRAPRARLEVRTEEGELRLTFFQGRALEWIPRAPEEMEGGRPDGEEEESAGFWQPLMITGALPVTVALPRAIVSGGMPRLSDMTARQLRDERRELLRLGIEDVTPLDVQIHRQVAFSFACFGFVLVGIPLGVRGHRRETSVGVAVAIGLVLVYYGFLIVAQALETSMEAVPWLIVWMPNALFQLTGAWLLWRADRAA
ncbi:MAG: LptF/LptG family permease [Verrucomicrobiae bacterium]|nr:LptF/LptG family permease [Verrucomicrobiae bacterium]